MTSSAPMTYASGRTPVALSVGLGAAAGGGAAASWATARVQTTATQAKTAHERMAHSLKPRFSTYIQVTFFATVQVTPASDHHSARRSLRRAAAGYPRPLAYTTAPGN